MGMDEIVVFLWVKEGQDGLHAGQRECLRSRHVLIPEASGA